MTPNRRDIGRLAIAAGVASLAMPALAKTSRSIRQAGNYNYRVRFSRKSGGRLAFWSYVTSRRDWNADVPFTLLVSTDRSASLSSGPNANSTFVVHSSQLLSDSTLSHTNRLTFKVNNAPPKVLYARLLIGPELTPSRVWPIRTRA